MPSLKRLLNRLRRQVVPTWYHPDYRLPLTSLSARTTMEPRRADLAAWYLLEAGAIRKNDLRRPPVIAWEDLCRVHDPEYLEGLTRPEALSSIFAVEPWDVPVDEVLLTIRLSCGGTLAAAREALQDEGPTLNLLGGMHHAGRNRGGGFCPVNDIAVALGRLRCEGFSGQVVVIDLDAHPPDGTADCLEDDEQAWVGSLSGSDWGPLPGSVDETVLPHGANDNVYLDALSALLGRMPRPALAFVIAGGDVRAGDPLGTLGLSEPGVQERDARVARALDGIPSVWLPGGGYGPESWRPLAGTGLVLALGRPVPIPQKRDPLRDHYIRISQELRQEDLGGGITITEEDLGDLFGLSRKQPSRLMGFYTRSGIEYGLTRYGFMDPLRRLGYRRFRVEIDRVSTGDRMRLFARSVKDPSDSGPEHLLVELVLEKLEEGGLSLLFIHWLTLRHPLAVFTADRPPLPGQEVPGLGMAREVTEILFVMSRRLGLDGLALRPAHLHVAWAGRHDFRFAEPVRQGRFEALERDLAHVPLARLTEEMAAGRVRMDGSPYRWEPDLMISRQVPLPEGWEAAMAAEREARHFTLAASAV